MGQGNCGEFTHNGSGRYAYDMRASIGTTIRAARGGKVVFVREDETGNCCPLGIGDLCLDPCPFPANAVVIEHQDGSVASYVHLPKDGATVAEGQFVRRGDPVGKVGNTGFSTGPHLHFVVKKEMGGNSIPSRFQTWSVNQGPGFFFPEFTIRNCFRPVSGSILFSTNKAWYE
jgi:murein DD-endopeptidase MepM/ murein hydrolase activator NlpD